MMAGVPALDVYQTPWEKRGEDYDPEKGRAFIHFLLTKADAFEKNLATAVTERADLAEEVTALTGRLSERDRESESDAERKERELVEARDALAKAGTEGAELKAMKWDVASDLDGISAKDAKWLASRLSGTTRDELEADAKEFVKRLNLNAGEVVVEDEPEDDDEADRKVRERFADGKKSSKTTKDSAAGFTPEQLASMTRRNY